MQDYILSKKHCGKSGTILHFKEGYLMPGLEGS